MNISAGLKAAAKSLAQGPKAESFKIDGKFVSCRQCENILFHKTKASLNTRFSSAVGMEWRDREACVLVCANCTRLEWFYNDLVAETEP